MTCPLVGVNEYAAAHACVTALWRALPPAVQSLGACTPPSKHIQGAGLSGAAEEGHAAIRSPPLYLAHMVSRSMPAFMLQVGKTAFWPLGPVTK
jgi:hypothetical protein